MGLFSRLISFCFFFKIDECGLKDFHPFSYYAHQIKVFETTGVYVMSVGEDKFI
jgi:hypothetical protein